VYHSSSALLALAVPFALLTDGTTGKIAGVGTAIGVSFHSWVGLNYVLRDYVPKFSHKLMGPARGFAVGISLFTGLGLSKMALSEGGLGKVMGSLWTKKSIEEKKEEV